MEIQIENLKQLVIMRELYEKRRGLAVDEFHRLVAYVEELEEIKNRYEAIIKTKNETTKN